MKKKNGHKLQPQTSVRFDEETKRAKTNNLKVASISVSISSTRQSEILNSIRRQMHAHRIMLAFELPFFSSFLHLLVIICSENALADKDRDTEILFVIFEMKNAQVFNDFVILFRLCRAHSAYANLKTENEKKKKRRNMQKLPQANVTR